MCVWEGGRSHSVCVCVCGVCVVGRCVCGVCVGGGVQS